MTHKRYLVTGTRKYRDNPPGTTFEAALLPDAERRAVERGSIVVLEVIDPTPTEFALPDDWAHDAPDAPPTRDESLASTAKEGK